MADRRRCFRCNYSLKGLPEGHRCPECGLPYYAWTALIEESPSSLYGGGVGLLLWFVVTVATFATGARELSIVVLVLFAGTWLHAAWGWRRGRRNRAAICDEGVFLYRWREADGELIPWNSIAGAVIDRFSSVILKDDCGQIRYDLPPAFFRSPARAKQFVLAVHDRLRRRGPLPPWVTTDRPGVGPE